jgi:SAM-dependent methyltransferase
MFASVVPGMTALAVDQLQRLPGVRVTDAGFDGRADLILFEAAPGSRQALSSLRVIEDLFVEFGRTLRASGDQPHWTAQRVWRAQRVEQALAVWSREMRGGTGRPITYRVIARVLQERSFLRSDLRRALAKLIGKDRPAWKVADPARLEVWISEYQPGRLVAGLRLSGRGMRQHDGREVERPGALRPTVAAMMVSLAGEPGGTLLDPCCGSGTILAEAAAAGWPKVLGGDIDPGAVRAARRNAPAADVTPSDARRTGLPGGSVAAVVSNLPFGQQYGVEGDMVAWLAAVLAELARVTRPGGRVVLLAPALPRGAMPASLRVAARHQIRLLGTRTTLWRCERL